MNHTHNEREMNQQEIIVDSFAGGGGASEGIHLALGRGPDIAINHDPEAIALHAANHPDSTHYCEDVWKVDPVEACAGRPVGLMWLSPDCKHFSKAKGGKPVNKKVRGLAWLAVRWAKAVQPRVIVLENVEEFQTWGPLGPDDKPCPRRKGVTFRRFIGRLRNLGYEVQWRELRACDFGAPTIRKRLFIIARRDGQPIVWPTPTHAKGGRDGLKPWRTAAECIDWGIPVPSIFDRKRPLAENTLRRIARGIKKFVLDSPRPFIVNTRNGERAGQQPRVRDIHDPMPTITAHGSQGGLVTPYIAGVGGRQGQSTEPFIVPMQHQNAPKSADAPLDTITTQGNKFNLVMPYIAGVGGRQGQSPERSVENPLQTITAKADSVVVTPMLVETAHGEVDRSGKRRTQKNPDIAEPMGTVLATGNQALDTPLATQGTANRHALVRAFLVAYFGNERDGSDLFDPMRTLSTRDRFGLVRVDGQDYEITDIGMRMLVPRELYNAQGFRPDYRIEIEYNGKPLSKTAQVRMVGNSVCPPMACAIVRANLLAAADIRMTA